jgi:hypothetical protein
MPAANRIATAEAPRDIREIFQTFFMIQFPVLLLAAVAVSPGITVSTTTEQDF